MAAKTFYPDADTAVSGEDFGSLTETSPGAPADTGTGWTTAKVASGNYAEMDRGSERPAAQFGTTALPDNTLNPTNGDAFRSDLLTGDFVSGNWTFTFEVRSVSGASGQGRLRIRVFRSANADGSAATELTGATQVTEIDANSTTAHTMSVVWNAPAISLTNEYLFVSVAWEITTAGSNNAHDALLRKGTNTTIVTTNFVAPTLDSATVTLVLTPSGTEEKQQYDAGTLRLRLSPRTGSMYDTFDTDTGRWTLSTLAITGGKLQASLPGGQFSSAFAGHSWVRLDDDFDLKVEIPDPVSNVGDNFIVLRVTRGLYNCEIYWYSSSGQGLVKNTLVTSSGTTIRDTTIASGVTACPRWLRIARAGNTHSWYYSDNGVDWTLGDSFASAERSPLDQSIVFYSEHYAVSPTETLSFDNFELTVPPVEVIEFGDEATATLVLTPSGTDEYTPGGGGTEYLDSDTVPVLLTPSTAEEYERVDSDTAPLVLTPSGTDERTQFDGDTVLVAFAPDSAEFKEGLDADTIPVLFTPATAEEYGHLDADTTSVVFAPSGTDVYIPAGLEDADTIPLTLTASSVDVLEVEDADTANLAFMPSAAEEHVTEDSGQIDFILSPSGTDLLEAIEESVVPLAFSPSGAEFQEYVDSDISILAFTPSGTDIADYVDSGEIDLLFTPSGIDILEQAGQDSDTIPLTLITSGIELAEYVDTATIPVLLTPSTIEFKESTDADLIPFSLAISGTDVFEGIDANTIPFLLAPSGVDLHESGNIYVDQNIVLVALMPASEEIAEYLDAAEIPLVLTPSGVLDFLDSGTIYLTFTPGGYTLVTFLLSSRAYLRWSERSFKKWSSRGN